MPKRHNLNCSHCARGAVAHYPNKNAFSDRQNLLHDKSASFKCDGRLFYSPRRAAGNALLPKMLYDRITTHVLFVERSRHSRASATRWQLSARYDCEMPDSDRWM